MKNKVKFEKLFKIDTDLDFKELYRQLLEISRIVNRNLEYIELHPEIKNRHESFNVSDAKEFLRETKVWIKQKEKLEDVLLKMNESISL